MVFYTDLSDGLSAGELLKRLRDRLLQAAFRGQEYDQEEERESKDASNEAPEPGHVGPAPRSAAA